MNRFRITFVVLLIFSSYGAAAAADKSTDRMVVHEWGTFTTLQDAEGQELLGINIDDEPVPFFVHNLATHVLDHAILSQDYWSFRQKGTPRQHPQVSMRLETPVIYFYPPTSAKLPVNVDVDVQFRGGWLTEFYPTAKSTPTENRDEPFAFDHLTPETVGRLTWNDLKVGEKGTFPTTDAHVWLSPRKVAAAAVTTPEGESEQYLFYRGVARLKAPLRVSTRDDGGTIELRANFEQVLAAQQTAKIENLWLVETRADGGTAHRRLESFAATGDPSQKLQTSRRRFEDREFSPAHRKQLEQDMHQALVAEGLYADEATALLTTWQRAYFASPGLRLFFTVPRVWTDHYLPLSMSGSPEVTRVMLGRIELVSDRQQEALRRLADIKTASNQWIVDLPEDSPIVRKLEAGRMVEMRDVGPTAPKEFELYLQLGRFRNALIVNEQRKSNSANLLRFVDAYGLSSFVPPASQQRAQ